MTAARVGIVGARRAAQGLGPFVARDLQTAGCRVVGFSTAHAETLPEAEAQLRAQGVHGANGYDDLAKMLDAESLDALVILSPSETHEALLIRAAQAGLHVLCEKPLVWGGSDLGARARARVGDFTRRSLLLAENCQWPWVLPSFRELHPGLGRELPQEFWMRLTPASSGEQAIGDCLPHPLSLLQELVPDADAPLGDLQISARDGDLGQLELRFTFGTAVPRTQVRLEFRRSPEVPRPAALSIDGCRAERRIELPSYQMELADGERRVQLPDPLPRRIESFVQDVHQVRAGAAPPSGEPLALRMAWIEQVVTSYRRQVDLGAAEGHPPGRVRSVE